MHKSEFPVEIQFVDLNQYLVHKNTVFCGQAYESVN